MLAGDGHHLLDFEHRKRRGDRVAAALRIKKTEHADAAVGFTVHALGELFGQKYGQRVVFLGLVIFVEFFALIRIGKDLVRLIHPEKTLQVARFCVVGMIAGRESAVHALDGLDLGVGTDAKEFVVVDVSVSDMYASP